MPRSRGGSRPTFLATAIAVVSSSSHSEREPRCLRETIQQPAVLLRAVLRRTSTRRRGRFSELRTAWATLVSRDPALLPRAVSGLEIFIRYLFAVEAACFAMPATILWVSSIAAGARAAIHC